MKSVDTDSVNVPDAEVRAEVDRILASKGFVSAGRLSRLLRYAVDKTIAGEADQLKEYAVGVEVFDRDANYDPRLDSIVRVEAGRLRSRLEEYYSGEGATSPIRISLPRGGYVAQFARRDDDGPSTFALRASVDRSAAAIQRIAMTINDSWSDRRIATPRRDAIRLRTGHGGTETRRTLF